MKYCIKCGSELENNICPSCSSNTFTNGELKKKSKKTKLAIIISTIILLGLFSGFFYASSHCKDKNEIVNEFCSAVSEKDSDRLQKILYSNNKELKINASGTKAMIEYLSNNPSEFAEVNKLLKNSSDLNTKFENNNPKKNIELKEVGKSFFIFPIYKVCIEPTFIKIKTNFNDVKVEVNDEIYNNLKENGEIGPLIPGEYKLNVGITNSYLDCKDTIKVGTFSNTIPEIRVFDKLKTININSDKPDAIIYINDKNTGVKIKDAKNFGPIEPSSVIYAITEENGKELVSKKYNLANEENLDIDFKSVKLEEEGFKKELYNLMESYSLNFAFAVNYNNYSYIKDFIEYGSPMYSKQSKVITQIHDSKIREDFEKIEILSYSYDKEKNIGELTCKETYGITKAQNVTKVKEFNGKYKFKKDFLGKLILTDIVDCE